MTTSIPLEPLDADQWFIDSPEFHQFVATVKDIRDRTVSDPRQTLTAIAPYFKDLLNLTGWLPEVYANPNPESGMGGGIGQWLLYRSQDRSLTVFSLVIPAGSITPVHDHLTWGLIGLYQGQQSETFYRRVDQGEIEGQADLEIVGQRSFQPGDLYQLLPPDDDIHSVKAISETASVSIHLMGNDTGSIWRHQFAPEVHRVKAFRSGYANAPYQESDHRTSVSPTDLS